MYRACREAYTDARLQITKRAIITVLAVGCIAGGVAAMGAMGVGSFIEDRLVSLMLPQSFFPYWCTDDDKRFASSLVTLGILDAHMEIRDR